MWQNNSGSHSCFLFAYCDCFPCDLNNALTHEWLLFGLAAQIYLSLLLLTYFHQRCLMQDILENWLVPAPDLLQEYKGFIFYIHFSWACHVHGELNAVSVCLQTESISWSGWACNVCCDLIYTVGRERQGFPTAAWVGKAVGMHSIKFHRNCAWASERNTERCAYPIPSHSAFLCARERRRDSSVDVLKPLPVFCTGRRLLSSCLLSAPPPHGTCAVYRWCTEVSSLPALRIICFLFFLTSRRVCSCSWLTGWVALRGARTPRVHHHRTGSFV